jgi:hypothetical protein
MDNRFFEQPILNSPYDYPARHWELDDEGQPTQQIVERRRTAEFITPIPKPRKRRGAEQQQLVFEEGAGVSTAEQQYDPTPVINALRSAESHPRVRAYVKNHSLGLEVPYRHGSETRRYLPDFIVLVDDGRGDDDLLHLVVEIKGYRREDAKEKKQTMETYWVPGINNLRTHGRWGFAELTEIYTIEAEFAAKVEQAFDRMIGGVAGAAV